MAMHKLLIFVSATLLFSCKRIEPSVTAKYKNVGNLKIGDKVTLNGVRVGEVLDFHIVKNYILADLSIQENIRVPADSRFVISQALLGPASIKIKQSNRNEFITRGDTISGELFEEPVLDSIKQKKAQAAVKKVVEGFAELMQALKEDSVKINK